jgi:hypothetical protein
MVFTVNWQHLARFAPKLAIGLGASAGMGYFINRTYCDLPKVVEKTTGIDFDQELNDFKLLGLGVRQVTFIKFNAYAVALYMQTKSLLSLGTRWKQEFTPSKLLNSPESEFYISDLLKKGKSLKLVIKTARNTDGPHLRNGFLKMLTLQYKSQLDLSDQDKEQVDKDLQNFKSLWSIKGTFKKGDCIVVTREADESLSLEFPDNPEFTGFSINNAFLCKWFFKSYLGAAGVSESLRESVSVGLHGLLSELNSKE